MKQEFPKVVYGPEGPRKVNNPVELKAAIDGGCQTQPPPPLEFVIEDPTPTTLAGAFMRIEALEKAVAEIKAPAPSPLAKAKGK